MRAWITAIVLLVLAGAAVPGLSRAENVYGDSSVIVALLDTGFFPTHQEFDYRGPDSADDQVVGWWDFTNAAAPALPAPGQSWDPRNPAPYDDHGHGTGTTSIAVGRNIGTAAEKTPSFAPGFKFAMGKVCTFDGKCPAPMGAGIRWAVDTINADVISVSIGAIAPYPEALQQLNEAADYARRAGVLVVVSNGNGVGDLGLVPDPGWATPNADSPYVLSVGASDAIDQFFVTTDPEVAGDSFTVPMASNACDACYATHSGTSFSAPLVAGMAASAIASAEAAGRTITPDALETLLKFCARDTETPPSQEGYGVLDAATMGCVRDNAAAGTLPARPDPDLNALYVEQGVAPLRQVWADDMDRGTMRFVPAGDVDPNGPGVLAFGNVAGLAEGDRYTLAVATGEGVTATMAFGVNEGGVEVLAFSGTGPTFIGADLIARSGWIYSQAGGVSFRAPADGTITLLVVCWSGLFPSSVTPPKTYDLQTATTVPATPEPVFAGEDWYATTTTYLG